MNPEEKQKALVEWSGRNNIEDLTKEQLKEFRYRIERFRFYAGRVPARSNEGLALQEPLRVASELETIVARALRKLQEEER